MKKKGNVLLDVKNIDLIRLKLNPQEFWDGVTTIGEGAFTCCKSLTAIIIPDSITKIEKESFYKCFNLKKVELPQTLVEIGESAFADCYDLNNISIPDSLTVIDKSAFRNCDSLKEITFAKNSKLEVLREEAFYNCESLQTINLPNNLNMIERRTFENCASLKLLDLPDNVEIIEERAFSFCSELKSIKISNNSKLHTIKDYAFSFSGLEEFIGTKSLKYILSNAFYNCEKLKRISIRNNTNLHSTSFSQTDINYYYDNNDYCIFTVDYPKLANRVYDKKEIEKYILNFDFTKIRHKPTQEFFKKCKSHNFKTHAIFLDILYNVFNYEDNDMFLTYINNCDFKAFQNEVNNSIDYETFKDNPTHYNNLFLRSLYYLANNLGCFSKQKFINNKGIETEFMLSQKASSLLNKLIKNGAIKNENLFDFYDEYSPSSWLTEYNQDVLKFFEVNHKEKTRGGTNKFKIVYDNVELLKQLSKKYPKISLKTLCYYKEIMGFKTTLSREGKPQNLPLKDTLIKFYNYSNYFNINEENKYIAEVFGKHNISQEGFEVASKLFKTAKERNVKNHILDIELKENLVDQEIENIKDETRSNLVENINLIKNLHKKQFAYEFLDKRKPENAIIGLYCSCCATITNIAYGTKIVQATILNDDVQNLVVRDAGGEIVAKGAMYVNKELGYAVINEFEINEKFKKRQIVNTGYYSDEETSLNGEKRELIFQAFLRGVNDFVKEYDKQNPDIPMQKVVVGMGYNRLKNQCDRYDIITQKLSVPAEYSFQDAEKEQRVLYDRDKKNVDTLEK